MASESVSQLTPPLKEEEIAELMHEGGPNYSLLKLGFMDSVSLRLLGYAKVGYLRRGGQDRRDVYLFKCKTHGVQIATPSGWSNKLVCSACLDELKKELDARKSISEGLDELSSVKDLKKYLTKNSADNK
jgi:hypothetical protein